jgi:hypothetical protein
VKTVARQEVMLKKADSAGIKVSDDEKRQLYGEFRNLLTSLWQQLGVDPKTLADSAKSTPERERMAAAHIERYLDRVMLGQAQPVRVPMPLQTVLTSKYKSRVIAEGVERAVERARKLRTVADSTRSAQQPRSQVPLPTPPTDTAARRDTSRGKRP